MSLEIKGPESFSLQDPLDSLLEKAQAKFNIQFESIKILDQELNILQIADMDRYVERLADSAPLGKGIELPYWAKIWPTSILLSYYLQRLPQNKNLNILELGSGVGVCGLVAAKCGFQVTMTDNIEDALLFAQINILKNNLEKKAQLARVDFTQDQLPNRFDLIFGSEVLYKESTYSPLIKFLLEHIKQENNSEIIIAQNYKLQAEKFFKLAEEKFDIQKKTLGYREKSSSAKNEQGEKHLCNIYRLKPL